MDSVQESAEVDLDVVVVTGVRSTVSLELSASQKSPTGIANLRPGLILGKLFGLDLGIENIFDKAYQDHLAGYNRVVPLRERLYSKGRNYYIRLNASW